MRRRVWLIAQAFPPVAGSHATRTKALAEALAKSYDVVGVSIEVGEGYAQRDGDVTSVHVIRTSPGLAHRAAHGGKPSMDRRNPGGAGFATRLRAVAIHAYRCVEVVDSYVDWIPHLVTALRQRISTDDLVVSTSMPNSCHVGAWLALLRRNNVWLADFGDPWTLDLSRPQKGMRREIESYLERKIMRRATLITFTTDGTRDAYAAKYPEHAERMSTVRMAYSPDDALIPPALSAAGSVFYGGSLPAENRSSGPLFQAAQTLSHLQFIFAGASAATAAEFFADCLPANVTTVPWLTHSDFIAHVKGCDVAIVVGNANPRQVPGKVYQLNAFARQVLYIRGIDSDTYDEALAQFRGNVASCANDSAAIAQGLEEMAHGQNSPSIANREGNAWPDVMRPLILLLQEASSRG